MILGVGIDTVSIDRFERLIETRGKRFLERVFAPVEISEGMKLARRGAFFASRFAAREAFVKALGTGFTASVGLRDIYVEKGKTGKPELRFSKRLGDKLDELRITRCHLSITHDSNSAQALVILERDVEKTT